MRPPTRCSPPAKRSIALTSAATTDGGRILVEAELDSPVAARRLRTYLHALYNAESTVVVVSGSSLRRGKRYVVRVVHKADDLARLTGLVDSMRRPVRGLPPVLVASGTAEAAAIWRAKSSAL